MKLYQNEVFGSVEQYVAIYYLQLLLASNLLASSKTHLFDLSSVH